MRHIVSVKRSVLKRLEKLPENIQRLFMVLVEVLKESGPTGPHGWKNYGKLGKTEYHCHLKYHYVACWRHEKNTIIIEVYYVGSRENAPY